MSQPKKPLTQEELAAQQDEALRENLEGLFKGITYVLIAPLASLWHDRAEAVKKRRELDEEDFGGTLLGWVLTIACPVATVFISVLGYAPPIAIYLVGVLTLISMAKRRAAKDFVPFTIVEVVTNFHKLLPKKMWIITAVLLGVFALLMLPPLSGLVFGPVLYIVGIPAFKKLGAAWVDKNTEQQSTKEELTRHFSIALDSSEDAINAIGVGQSGDKYSGTWRGFTGALPVEILRKIESLEARLVQFLPEYEVSTATPDGVVLVQATEETQARRAALAASGGLIASTTDAPAALEAPSALEAPTGFMAPAASPAQDWDF